MVAEMDINQQIGLLEDAQESVIVAKSLSDGEHFTIRNFRMARDKYLDLHKVNPRDIRRTIDVMKAALEDIATSDDIDNALDPARNKRVALAALTAQ